MMIALNWFCIFISLGPLESRGILQCGSVHSGTKSLSGCSDRTVPPTPAAYGIESSPIILPDFKSPAWFPPSLLPHLMDPTSSVLGTASHKGLFLSFMPDVFWCLIPSPSSLVSLHSQVLSFLGHCF